MYLVFTRMPGQSYRRRLRSLLLSCDVFRALINSLVCWNCIVLDVYKVTIYETKLMVASMRELNAVYLAIIVMTTEESKHNLRVKII